MTIVMNGHRLADGGSGDDPVAERLRLEAELAALKQRIDDARRRAHAKDVETRAALRDELAATRELLADIEREHARDLAELRAAADAQVARVLDEARRRVGQVGDDA